jgi:pyruvate formate lyase activating enzyme
MKEAMYYRPLDNQIVQCVLCPHNCIIEKNDYGKCGVRQNRWGKLYATNYGCITASAVDPIEKKPLYHFYPGEEIYSIASYGCNMSCQYCQNYELSQSKLTIDATSLESVMQEIEGIGIAFTYNEPVVWYEFVYDLAKKIKEEMPEKKVVMVTNGFINPEPLKALLPYVDAFNIDLKSFSEDFYETVCGGRLEPVLETIRLASEKHLEVTTLMVSNYVSSDDIVKISEFIASIDVRIPLHISRYFPNYQMNQPATSTYVLMDACNKARKILNHVYLGNVRDVNNNTICNQCGELLIQRKQYNAKAMIRSQKCPQCGYDNKLVGLDELR